MGSWGIIVLERGDNMADTMKPDELKNLLNSVLEAEAKHVSAKVKTDAAVSELSKLEAETKAKRAAFEAAWKAHNEDMV